MTKLYPARDKDITKLRADFKSYKDRPTGPRLAIIKREAQYQQRSDEQALGWICVRGRGASVPPATTLVESPEAGPNRPPAQPLRLSPTWHPVNLCVHGVLVFFIPQYRADDRRHRAERHLELRVAERTAQLSQKPTISTPC